MGCLGEMLGIRGTTVAVAARSSPRVFMLGPCLATVHARNPPLGIVRRFIHLLEQSQHDFWEESEVLRLQEEVVKRIRANRQLESDLDLMDIKIGLLVKNRITLQEVVSHCKKLTKKNKEQLSEMMSIDKQKGLKSLSKEKRQKLEAYQHLFYLLQVGLVGPCCVHHSWRSRVGTLSPPPPHGTWG
ncbi:ras gtpase-activating-like protein hypothetical protein [Limosa lapponica baueri]|uniref:Uncharacterized protein n=1 Tax=Limosa lapponica baueri TaxID=1758121 RepID=A0A2I0SZJ7_LIMLA|nr:ras gtpase-activating-like protein hypothetical protein [Limosa lapponica baueri]